MKRFCLTVLAMGVALSGCAQKTGKQEASRLDRLESGFTHFQEQQRSRDAEIDNRLREITVILEKLSAGQPPVQKMGRKERQARTMAAATSSRRPIVAGQVVPYDSLAGGSRTQPAVAPAPTPLSAPAAASRPAQPLQAPAPGAPTQVAPIPAAPAAAASPSGPMLNPPVVTLGQSTYAPAPTRQPVPMTTSRHSRHKGGERAPHPVASEAAPAAAPVPAATPAPAVAPAPAAPAAPAPAIPTMAPTTPAPAPAGKPSASVAQPAQAAAPAAGGSVNMQEQLLYTEALRAVSSNRNDEGRKKFNDFLAKYPNSSKTPEALYWIGESYMGDKSYNQAILSFKEVTARFPKDPKSEEALYRIAEAYERLGDKSNAAFNLKLLVDEHPNSEFTNKAKQKLKQLGQ